MSDHLAVVALEPDIIRQVVKDHGREPARLTLIRKARGDESHKGGQAIGPDDPAGKCLTSWLASEVDTASCFSAVPRLNH
jgi:hypothetical protein